MQTQKKISSPSHPLKSRSNPCISVFQLRRSSAVISPLSSKVESAVIIRLLAEVDAAAALCSDKPVGGWWPPAGVRFITVLPRLTRQARPQMETERIESPMPLPVCVTVEHHSKNADKTISSALIWLNLGLYNETSISIMWKHVVVIHRQESRIIYLVHTTCYWVLNGC